MVTLDNVIGPRPAWYAKHSISGQTEISAKQTAASISIFFGLFFVFWTAYSFCSQYPGFVHKDTAEIAMWASQGFTLGHAKHPPLLTWLVGLFGLVFPVNQFTLAILSGLNLTVAAFATWRIAVICIGERRAAVALLIYAVMPYLTFQVMKLNHNAILVSLWPLTVWAYLVVSGRPSIIGAMALGGIASFAVLAKYSSVILLFGLVAASLVSANRYRFYRSSAPYLSVALFIILVSPHFIWTMTNGNPGIQYAARSFHAVGTLPWLMLKENALNLVPAVIATMVAGKIFGWQRLVDEKTKDTVKQVIVIATTTYMTTIALTTMMGLRHSPTWTMPVFPFVAVILAAFVNPPDWDQVRKLRRWGLVALAGLAITAPIVLYITFVSGLASAVDPRRELGQAAVEIWNETRDEDLRIVGGDYYTALSVSLETRSRPGVWQFRDTAWVSASDIERHGALFICKDHDTPCQQKADVLLRRVGGLTCEVSVSRTLLGSRSANVRAIVYVVAQAKPRIELRPRQTRTCSQFARQIRDPVHSP
jgi:hypothetical protein